MVTIRGPNEPRRGTLLGELNIISDGAVLIRDGTIQDVGPTRRVERLADAREAVEIDATGRLVMPAFVDGHAHVAFAHTPVPSDEESLSGRTRQLPATTSEGARALTASPRLRLETRCRILLEDMVRHGTGTVEAQIGPGLDDSTELKVLRIYRALNGHPADVISTHTPVPASSGAERLLRTLAQRNLIRFVDLRCGPDDSSTQVARNILQVAKSLGLGLKLQAPGRDPDRIIGLAVELDAATISHVNYIGEADIGLLAESATIAVLCPGASYESRTGPFAPARALIEGGAAVSLASNFNAGSSPFFSMPFILSLACRHMRMTAAEAIAAATINAAYAAGRGSHTGSIEPGKQADLILCNAQDYREIPHFGGSNPVHMTIKKGTVVYQAAKVRTA